MNSLGTSPRNSTLPSDRGAPRAFTRRDWAPLILLLAAHVAMFWKVLFTPAMFFYRDVYNYSYPHARFIQQACRAGFLPYWNPLLNYGEPVLANPNFLFFYPSTVLLIALPVDLAYTLHYVIHFMLAAVGAYGLARRWGQSRLAAFVAGFVFSMSGPVLSLGNLYNHAAAAAWIPWALLVTDVAVARRSRQPFVLLTLIFTLQFLASEPFTLFATFILCLAYALFEAGDRRRPQAAANLRLVGTFAVVGTLMVALSAVQLLPSLHLLSNAQRGLRGLPFNETTSWSIHPLHLLEWVVPGFFGSAIETPTLWTMVLSNRNMPYYLSSFLGFVPLFLAFVGWALGKNCRRNFAGFGALIFLVLAFGRFTPVFALAYLLFPPLALVRFPAKLIIPMMLLVAVLAGWGLDTLRECTGESKTRARRVMVYLGVILALVVVVWLASLVAPGWVGSLGDWILLSTNQMFVRTPAGELTAEQVAWAAVFFVKMLQIHLPGVAGFVLGGILWLWALERHSIWSKRVVPAAFFIGIGQLAWVNYSANPTVPKTFYSYQPPVLDHFDPSGKPYRFAYVFREAQEQQTTPDVQGFVNFDSIPEARDLPPRAQVPFRDRLILARATMLLDVEGVMNIDVEHSYPIYLYDFWTLALRGLADSSQTACLLGRTNVRYQVLRARTDDRTQREVAPIFNGSPDPHYLYEILCTMPRAYAVRRARVAPNAFDALRRLADPKFDAAGEIFLPAGSQIPTSNEEPGAAGTVEIVKYAPNEVVVRAALNQPGYVVLLDRFDPNWHASSDGHEVPVLRANHVFRAVHGGAGTHEVRFFYRQRGLKLGLALSLGTFVLLAFLYFKR